jgi:GntR family transcriptional regulator of vanillate catabolism
MRAGYTTPESPLSTQLDQALVHLREMILRGKLAPGQRVAEAPLAEELGMSRTPVRQALPLLAQEGLLSLNDTRGYVVRAFTWAEVGEALELRGVLEGLAARRVAQQGASKAFLREMRTCLDEGDRILRKRRVEDSSATITCRSPARRHWPSTRRISSGCTTCSTTRTGSIMGSSKRSNAVRAGALKT